MATPPPHDLARAKATVQELDLLSRTLVELLAVFFDPTPRSYVAQALARMGHRFDGKMPTAALVLPALEALEARGIVEYEPQFHVTRHLVHAATLSAIERGVFAAMAATVRAVRPGREREATLRDLRLALYAGRWDEARPLAAAVGPAALAYVCHPLDRAWLVALPADLRTLALRGLLSASASTLEPAPEALALLQAERALDDKAHRVLVEQMVLRGRLDDAERLLEGRASIEADVGRSELLFMRGRRAEAIAAYEAALRAFFAQAGKRAKFFPDRAGMFFIVALLDEDRAPARRRALTLADAGAKNTGYGLPQAYAALSEVARVRGGELGKDGVLHAGSGLGHAVLDPFEALARVLAAGWIGTPVDPDLAAELERRVARAEAAGYAWLAGQGAGALLATGFAGADETRLRALRDAVPGVALAGLLHRTEPWADALDALLEVASAKKPKAAGAEAAPEHDRRLVWIVVERYGHLDLEPREQVRQKGGFSKGRPVAMKRLYEDASTMAFLRDEDRAACRLIEQHVSSGYYRDVSYVLDDGPAMLALVGHPAVFTEAPGKSEELVPAEIRHGRARLRVERSPEGLHLVLDPMPRSPEETLVTRRVGPAAFEVVDLAAAHHAVARVLGKKGLVVPSAAEDRVRAVLGALSGVVAVDAEIDAGAGAEAAPGDTTPRILLRPLGAGLSAELAVRPLGPLGPTARPGAGGTTLLAEVGGHKRRASRDLAAEARLLDEVLAACATLGSAERTAAGLALPDRERALDALAELRRLGDRVHLEWPEGEPLAVTDDIGLGDVRFDVSASGDEIAVDGALTLPDGRRIALAELLGYLAAAPGRFLQIKGDPRYLALHEDLRRRLAELSALLGPGKRPHLPALLAPLVDELLDGTAVDADAAFQQRLAAWAPGPEPRVPRTFAGELRPYQRDGFRWLARLGRLGAGACLADDMGLGKTVEALALLLLRAPEGPSLVVAPTSVVPGWLDETARFAPTLRPRLFAGEGRGALLDDLGPFDLVVTSYALLQQDASRLSAVPWNVAVLDEAQAIKNAATRRAQAAAHLRAQARIAMTGTPVENRLEDLHGIFRFLSPSLLGSAESFGARFVRPVERDRDPAAEALLRRVVGPFVLRRTKTDVLPELPPRTEVTRRVALSVEEIALYEAIRAEALASLAAPRGEGRGGQRRIQILASITRLRRAASHPRLVLPEAELAGSKLSALGELLDEILPGGHRVLVFSQFVDHLTLVRAFLDERGVTYQYLDGSTPAAARKAVIAAFQAGEGDAFLISLRAGGFGLNLTAADVVVHMDPWWNPAVEDQASDRAHRIGQTRPVTIYRLVARDTIEDQILALHHKKRELAASLLEGTEVGAAMSEEEMLDLILASGREGDAPKGRAPKARKR